MSTTKICIVHLVLASIFVQKALSFTHASLNLQERWKGVGDSKSHFLTRTTQSETDNVNPKSPHFFMEDSEPPLEIKTKRSLYEILRASRNATRTELKFQYITLAKETHPDALIGSDYNAIDTTVSFSEVAEAWKILSNPKNRRRYDRSLQTEVLADNIEEMAVKVSEQAGPSVMKIFERVAVPFFRRTAVTAVATFSAAAQDLVKTNGTKVDFGHAVSMALKAGTAAGRIVDGMELLERSHQLQESALEEMERAMKVKNNLALAIEERFDSITTEEASAFLDETQRALRVQARLSNVIDKLKNTTATAETTTLLEETKQALVVQAKYKTMMDSLMNATLIYEATRTLEVARLAMELEIANSSADVTVLKEIEVHVNPSTRIDDPIDESMVIETERSTNEHINGISLSETKAHYETEQEMKRSIAFKATQSKPIDESIHSVSTHEETIFNDKERVKPSVTIDGARAVSDTSLSTLDMRVSEKPKAANERTNGYSVRDATAIDGETERALKVQAKLSAVIDELLNETAACERSDLEERERSTKVQAKLSEVIDEIMKATWDI